MLDWLSSFGNFLNIIIEYFISFLRNTVEVVLLIYKGFYLVSQVIFFLPPQYKAILVIIISFAVIINIINFGG